MGELPPTSRRYPLIRQRSTGAMRPSPGNAAVSYGYASKGSCESLKPGSRGGLTVSRTVKGGASVPGAITAPDATNPHADATPQATTPQEKKGIWQKLAGNAQYQPAKQKRAVMRTIRVPDSSQAKQEDRARDIESHSCMTTDGADKANQLADDCNKVTNGPHPGCNIQENTCEEIRKTTQQGCWGLAASAPDLSYEISLMRFSQRLYELT